MATFNLLFHIFGALEASLSFSVVATGLLFPDFMLSPKRVFPHMLFMISLCDSIVGVSFSWGNIDLTKSLCATQGFITSFFYQASWIFTTLLLCQLRSVMLNRRVWLRVEFMHLICWPICALLALLPLSSHLTYGPSENSQTVCYMTGNDRSVVKLWFFLTYYGCLLTCLIVMVVIVVNIALKFDEKVIDHKDAALRIYQTMRWYPSLMFIFWCPQCFYFLSVVVRGGSLVFSIYNPMIVWSSLNGPALAVVFFTHSYEARQRWARFLGCKPKQREASGISLYDESESFDLSVEDEEALWAQSHSGLSQSARTRTNSGTSPQTSDLKMHLNRSNDMEIGILDSSSIDSLRFHDEWSNPIQRSDERRFGSETIE